MLFAGSSITWHPGNFAMSSRAFSLVIFFANWALIEIEWAVRTGTRTVVQVTRRSGIPMILRPSFVIFISSFVYPLSRKASMCGMTLKAIWCLNADTSRFSPLAYAFVWAMSSAIALAPAPEVAWYDDATTLLSFP